MDRRDSLRTLLLASLASGSMTLTGCDPNQTDENGEIPAAGEGYGRTEKEKKHDQELFDETFFEPYEMETMAVLVDIILPANADFGSATDAGVPDFIEFMVKDWPKFQTPIRGGLMWLNNRSNRRFNKEFKICTPEEQYQLCDEIAYPKEKEEEEDPSLLPGIKFFSLMRNLTLTGYYTTKMGFEDLGYVGNRPNDWDGIPDEVLAEHDVDYEPEWLAKCIDQDTRLEIAKWDEEGNLI